MMKFWELVSILRDQEADLRGVLAKSSDPRHLEWLEEFAEICDRQDRTILDAPVPEHLVTTALARLRVRFYVEDGYLRVADSPARASLSAAEVALGYGAARIEEVMDKGSSRVG